MSMLEAGCPRNSRRLTLRAEESYELELRLVSLKSSSLSRCPFCMCSAQSSAGVFCVSHLLPSPKKSSSRGRRSSPAQQRMSRHVSLLPDPAPDPAVNPPTPRILKENLQARHLQRNQWDNCTQRAAHQGALQDAHQVRGIPGLRHFGI